MKKEIIALRDYLLQHNTYYQKGFVNVMQRPNVGLVANSSEIVFPTDNQGDYFYLRSTGIYPGVYDTSYTLSYSKAGLGFRYNMTMVGVVEGADEDLLVQNIINSLHTGKYDSLTITNVITDKHLIISQELSFLPDAALQKAHQNTKANTTIVAVSFSYNASFYHSNCIVNPC